MKKIILATALLCALLAIGVTGCIIPDVDDSEHIHSFGEWETTKAPTCTDAGERAHTCTECGETETEAVKALGHDEKSFESKAPTCTEDGYTAYTECTRCGASTKEVVEALGHDLGNYTSNGESGHTGTCTRDGCKESKTEEHSFEEGICSVCGEYDTFGTEGLEYSFINDIGAYRVNFYAGNETDIRIPYYYDDGKNGLAPVAAIDSSVFHSPEMKSVIIPESVTSIGAWAFSKSGIESITLPSGLKKIGEGAFYDCTSLSEIYIPSGIELVDSAVFENCPITYTEYEGAKYIGNEDNPYLIFACVNDTGITEIKIHENTRVISGDAFKFCSALTSVTLPDSVVGISQYAFNCAGVSEIVIGKGLTVLDEDCFDYGAIKTVILSKNVSSVPMELLRYKSIESIQVSEDNTYFKSVDGVLYSADGKTLVRYPAGKSDRSLTVPDGVEKIGDYAFSGALEMIMLPESTTVLGKGILNDCTALETLVVLGCITECDKDVFALFDCANVSVGFKDRQKALALNETGDKYVETEYYFVDGKSFCGGTFKYIDTQILEFDLSTVSSEEYMQLMDELIYYLSNGAAKISVNFSANENERAFMDIFGVLSFATCENLSLKISGAEKIPDNAFNYCDTLVYLNIGNGVKTIGITAFQGCANLKTISFTGNDLERIENCAFEYCTSLRKINIPDSVTYIGAAAFYNCTAMTYAQLGLGITTVEDLAFYECTSLETVRMDGTIRKIGESAFEGCDALIEIDVLNLSLDEWEAVEKGSDWIDKTGVSVICSDHTSTTT